MSTIPLKVLDEKILEKAKRYAKDRRLETLEATIEVFEATPNDDEYKTTLFGAIKMMVESIDSMDTQLAKYRESRKYSI